MKQKPFIQKIISLSFLFLLFLFLGFPLTGKGDQAQYFYDNLGRLVGVSDGQGNMAIYTYDSVGNLLSIKKYTSSTSGIGIFLLTPSQGTPGTQVQIQGYGFSPNPSDNQVSFNGPASSVISSTANTIITTVPNNAISGQVTVTNSHGTAVSPSSFTVLQLPIISGISPNQIAQGTTNYNTVITGFNLSNAESVTFNQSGIRATILSGGTSNQLSINLRADSNVPVGTYSFSVVTAVGTGQSGTVVVKVGLPVASTSAAGPISVFLPSKGFQSTSLPESAETLPLSVFKPPSVSVSPSGAATAVASPESVKMP